MHLTKIPHSVQAREPPKFKKLKIRVARKLDLIAPNWVYSFSSFIRPYQTHIVRPILFLGCWTVLVFHMFCHKIFMRIYKKLYLKISSHTFEVKTDFRYFVLRDFIIRVFDNSSIFYSGFGRIIVNAFAFNLTLHVCEYFTEDF
jgi:hypothetical protein